MTEFVKIEEYLYARKGKRTTSYSTVVDGKYKSLGNDLSKAREELAKLKGMAAPRKHTIRAMCLGFIAEQKELLKARDSNALSERTIEEYEANLEKRMIPAYGDWDPADFKAMHAAQYLARRRKGDPANGIKGAPTGANREVAALASAFNYGMREGMVETNPCHGVKRNRERPRTRKVDVSEFNEFMKFAKQQTKALYMAALIGATVAISGRRRAELLHLTTNAITPEGIKTFDAKVKPGEAQRTYTVQWSKLLVQIFNEVDSIRSKKSIYLFPNREGLPYTDQGFKCTWNKLIRRYEKQIGERFRAHDLRAMYVTEMLEQDRDPNTHRNKATMVRVYDRRRDIKVEPLA